MKNYIEKFPDDPLTNFRGTLTASIPADESVVITYGYPENKILDFTDKEVPQLIVGGYYRGNFLNTVPGGERSPMPYLHFDTSLEIKSGASGGPVFNSEGRVVGVNCRGWDFAGAEHEDDHLSSITPIFHAMEMTVPQCQFPKESWEWNQIPEDRRTSPLTFRDLINYGHILLR